MNETLSPATEHPVITLWKESLRSLLAFYDRKRRNLRGFYLKLFAFFVILNITCYWWAMFTAFPDVVGGAKGWHYFKLQFPVGLMGALFDSLSFFVTIWIARRALQARSATRYVAHLSVDLVIAALATCWVLFIFSFSGWLIYLLESQPTSLALRNAIYHDRAVQALMNPFGNMRNIYFGLIMGASAMLPTCLHLTLSLHAILKAGVGRFTARWTRQLGSPEDHAS